MARRSAARRRGSIVAYGPRAEVAGWQTLAARAQSLVQGANAAVVGILGAALSSPVFISAIGDLRDFALALARFVLLVA